MKRYLKNFTITEKFVKNSIYECLDGSRSHKQRWTRYDVINFLMAYTKKYAKEFNKEITDEQKIKEELKKIVKHKRYRIFPLIDYIARDFYNEIINESILFPPICYKNKYDTLTKKNREIGITSIKQQCFDYIVVNACKEMFKAKIGHYQCASLKLKGQTFGKTAIESWIRTNPKKCKWVYKADIEKFFPSVDHDKLKEKLKRDIKNEKVLYILFTLIDTYKKGLCIGTYLSQYLANYYLSYAYHYITENLYTIRRNKRINYINYALFYMDDIILFSSNKKYLKRVIILLDKYLDEQLGLKLKPSRQLFPLDSRPIDMMGYKIYTYKTIVRKRIFKRANKVFNKAKNKNSEMKLEDAYKIISYNGYFTNSWSKKYAKKVKLTKSINQAKEMISKNGKSNV